MAVILYLSVMFTGMNERWFRAVAAATDCNDVASDESRLYVEGPLTVGTHPSPQVACSGSPETFTAVINNPGAGTVQYRWQVSTDGGTTWTSLVNNLIFNGTGTNTLSIGDVAGMHGYCFRLRYGTSTCNDGFTNEACLTVEGPISVTGPTRRCDAL